MIDTNGIRAIEAEPTVRRCIWCHCPETTCVCFELDELREARDDERRERERERCR